MKNYIGLKLIEAEPMTALEAAKKGYYRGDQKSDDELNTMEGYHVRYTNNDYHSWSPKDVFEKSYKEIDVEKEYVESFGKEMISTAPCKIIKCTISKNKLVIQNRFKEYAKTEIIFDNGEEAKGAQAALSAISNFIETFIN